MNYWLMKSEPETYGIDHLKALKTDHWDGVRNYQARNFMRDDMQIGDQVFFYHSNCKVPGIVGTMKVASAPYADHTAFDPTSKYFDDKSSQDNPRWFMVDVRFSKKFPHIISLSTLKETPGLESMRILQRGNRLSITPVTKQEWEIICQLATKG